MADHLQIRLSFPFLQASVERGKKDVLVSPYAYCGNNPVLNIDPTGMDWWSTNDPDEIRRFIESLQSFESLNNKTFGDRWSHMTNKEIGNAIQELAYEIMDPFANNSSEINEHGLNINMGTYGTPDTNYSFDYKNSFHYVGPLVGSTGIPIKHLKPVGALGSTPGSSIISYTLSRVAPINMGRKGANIAKILTGVRTTNLGRFMGRLLPGIGWVTTTADAYHISIIGTNQQVKHNIIKNKNPLDNTVNPTTGKFYIPGSFDWLKK